MFVRFISTAGSINGRLSRISTRGTVRNFIQESGSKPSDAISAENKNAEVKLSRKERIINYFKMVKYDYSEALKEVTEFYKVKPIKAGVSTALVAFGLYAAHNNPDERSYWDNFVVNSQDLSMIGDPVRNPGSQRLVDYVSRAYNAGLVRRLNLGVASLMWVDNYDAGMGLYAARCDYLQPSWTDMRHRVIDVGFLGRWWIADTKMEMSDVNTEEWNEDGSPANKATQLKPMW